MTTAAARFRWSKGARGREAELREFHDAIVHDRRPFHDGRWGEATLEVCLGVLESARERREVYMSHQVGTGFLE